MPLPTAGTRCPRARAIPDWRKRAWRRQHFTSLVPTSLVSTPSTVRNLSTACAGLRMRLSPRPSVSPSSPSPQLLDWTHKAGTDPESYGRRCVRVLLPPPLRLGTCSCCTPPPHRRRLRHASTFAQLQLSGIHVLRTPPAPPSFHPPIHPSIYGRFISDILTLVIWRLRQP